MHFNKYVCEIHGRDAYHFSGCLFESSYQTDKKASSGTCMPRLV